jgi:hypothetical protein
MNGAHPVNMQTTPADKVVGIRVSHHQDVTTLATQGDITVAIV